MENFQEKLAQLPTEIKRAWSVGFVLLRKMITTGIFQQDNGANNRFKTIF